MLERLYSHSEDDAADDEEDEEYEEDDGDEEGNGEEALSSLGWCLFFFWRILALLHYTTTPTPGQKSRRRSNIKNMFIMSHITQWYKILSIFTMLPGINYCIACELMICFRTANDPFTGSLVASMSNTFRPS